MAFAVRCPECGSSLEVEDEHREWTVRCPHCRHEFRPAQATAAKLTPVEDNEEHDDRPRRKRRRRRKRGDPDKGAAAIAMPGLVLEVIAWLSVVGTVAVCAILIGLGTVQAQQPPPANAANDDPPELLIFLGFCLGIIAVPYYIAIAVGARKMRHLTSFKWGMTAAIMAVVAIVLFGLLALPIIGPGIWAVVAMNNDDVKAAFEKHDPNSHDDDDDD